MGCPDWCRNACIAACPTRALKGNERLAHRVASEIWQHPARIDQGHITGDGSVAFFSSQASDLVAGMPTDGVAGPRTLNRLGLY